MELSLPQSRHFVWAYCVEQWGQTPWVWNMSKGCPHFPHCPVFAHRRRRLACRTGKTIAARQLCQAQQGPRVLQAAPAVHQHEGRDSSVPDGLRPDGETDESCHSDQAEDRGHHQAASSSEHKPEQGAKNLAAIQGIDGKDVEHQQAHVNPEDGLLQQR